MTPTLGLAATLVGGILLLMIFLAALLLITFVVAVFIGAGLAGGVVYGIACAIKVLARAIRRPRRRRESLNVTTLRLENLFDDQASRAA
jgi:polyferredoxin